MSWQTSRWNGSKMSHSSLNKYLVNPEKIKNTSYESYEIQKSYFEIVFEFILNIFWNLRIKMESL